jgi:hypothetical protein
MGIIAIAAVLPLFPSSLPQSPFCLLLLLLLYFKN